MAWTPPTIPGFTGVAAPNEVLKHADLIAAGRIIGAEDVGVDDQGRIYGSTQGEHELTTATLPALAL